MGLTKTSERRGSHNPKWKPLMFQPNLHPLQLQSRPILFLLSGEQSYQLKESVWLPSFQTLSHLYLYRDLNLRSWMAVIWPNSCPLSQWCHPTISSSVVPFSPTFNLSQHQGLFKWVSSLNQVAIILEFQLEHPSFQWTPRTYFP